MIVVQLTSAPIGPDAVGWCLGWCTGLLRCVRGELLPDTLCMPPYSLSYIQGVNIGFKTGKAALPEEREQFRDLTPEQLMAGLGPVDFRPWVTKILEHRNLQA